MHYLRLSLALGLAGLTAACGQKVETPVSSETTGSIEMAMAPAAATPILAKGHGTVTAIDKGAGTITLAHGPIPEAKWPAMTMAFKAAPAITDTAQVGDKVDFNLKIAGSAGEVMALTRQP
ncbi:MAG: copper-binding protein [Alphaproteobacteria bacterium]|nr:copper-binding protein [Alphaproteobacteria bacterium]